MENNKAIDSLNDKFLKILKDRGIIASYLLSALSKITNPENTTEFKLLKSPNSKRVNDLLRHTTMPFTVYNHSLTFCDTSD